jgi:ABC-2 type transport system permease protein
MRKVLVIAVREYNAAVRTKAFLISLVLMPVMMGGSLAVQAMVKDKAPTEVKHIAVLDLSPRAELVKAVDERARTDPKVKGAGGKQLLFIEPITAGGATDEALDRVRREQAERMRRGEIVGFLEIGPDVLEPLPRNQVPDLRHVMVYRTTRPLEQSFPNLARTAVNERIQEKRINARIHELNDKNPELSSNEVKALVEAVELEQSQAGFFLPFGLSMLMFMIVMLTTTPLMQGVLEEKMNRVAEVLLGSVRPFPLMLGKLLGMTGAALTVSAVYLTGGYLAARHYGLAEYLPANLLAWFVVFQTLAVLMFGSLFIAIGSACTDMKETQSLMWPVMLLVTVPFFVLVPILQEPNSTLAVAASFFPFATPMLMTARMGVAPGMPWWQPVAAVVVMLVTTLACVWAAGRIFRVGILMQGKGARMGELARWVLRG